MVVSAPWTCPTCKTIVTTPFCSQCGEGPVAPHDLTLFGLAEKVSRSGSGGLNTELASISGALRV